MSIHKNGEYTSSIDKREHTMSVRERFNRRYDADQNDKELLFAKITDLDFRPETTKSGKSVDFVIVDFDGAYDPDDWKTSMQKKSPYWTDEAKLIMESIEIGNEYRIKQERDSGDFLKWAEISLVKDASVDNTDPPF